MLIAWVSIGSSRWPRGQSYRTNQKEGTVPEQPEIPADAPPPPDLPGTEVSFPWETRFAILIVTPWGRFCFKLETQTGSLRAKQFRELRDATAEGIPVYEVR